MKKEMTCIVCPIGCRMTVLVEDGKLVSISGNTCKRGEAYAVEEATTPKRVLTTTVRSVINGQKIMIPVKTKSPIPKELLLAAMAELNKLTITQPVVHGQEIISDLLNTGVSVISGGSNVQHIG